MSSSDDKNLTPKENFTGVAIEGDSVVIPPNAEDIILVVESDSSVSGTVNVELEHSADNVNFVAAQNQPILTSPISFALNSNSFSVNEGASVTISLITVNVPNGTIVPYTISGVSSADIGGASLTGNFNVGTTNSVTLNIASDSLTEGVETLNFALDNGKDSVAITINDTSTSAVSYSLARSTASASEDGGQIDFTLTTTGVLDGTSVPFTITGIQSADITQSLTGNFIVTGGSATTSINHAFDLLTAENETYTLTLDNSQASITGTISDSNVTLSSSSASVDEGNSVTITATSTNVASGTNIPYTVTGVSSADIGGVALFGAFVEGTTNSVTFNVTADSLTEGAETLVLSLNNSTPTISTSVTINDTSTSPATFSLSSTPSTSVDEGNTLTIDLATTNVSDGTSVPYTITGVSSADISGASLTGNFTVNSNAAQLVLTIAADATTEGAETLNFALDNGADSFSITVNDTSTTPAPTYTLSRSAASVNEGSSVDITLTTTNVSDGTNVPYTITGIQSADLSGGSLTGNFTITSNSATLTFGLAADATTEGAETLSLALDNGADTITVTVNDTSTTPVTGLFSNKYAVVGTQTTTPVHEWEINGSELSLIPSLTSNVNTFPDYTDEYTIAFWMRIQTGGEGGGDLSNTKSISVLHMQVGSNGAGLQVMLDNTSIFKCVVAGTTLNNYQITTVNTGMTGTWHHMALVYKGNGFFDIYQNGVSLTTSTSTSGSTTTINNEISSATISNTMFDGHYITVGGGNVRDRSSRELKLDEFMGINIGLNQAQVTELYNKGNPQVNSNLSFSSNIDSHFRMGDYSTDDIVNFDFKDTKNTNRSIVDAYSGSQAMVTLTEADQPFVGKYANLLYAQGDLNSPEFALIGTDKSIFPSLGTTGNYFPSVNDAFSISMWVKFSNYSSSGYTVPFQMINGSSAQIKFYHSANTCYYSFTRDSNTGNCTVQHGIGSYDNNGWNHLVVTKASGTMTPGNITIYIDGSVVTTSTQSNTFGTGTTAWDDDTVAFTQVCGQGLRSAVSGNSLGRSQTYLGVDELIGWSKELSSTEVTALWNSGVHPDVEELSFYSDADSWFRMGDGTNDSLVNMQAYDIKDATRYIENGHTTHPLSFSGLSNADDPFVAGNFSNTKYVSDVIRETALGNLRGNYNKDTSSTGIGWFPDIESSGNFRSSDNVSWSFWVKSNVIPGNLTMLFYEYYTTDEYIQFGMASSNRLSIYARDGANSSDRRYKSYDATLSTAIFDGDWHHICITTSSADVVTNATLYVDGTAQTPVASALTHTITRADDTEAIGLLGTNFLGNVGTGNGVTVAIDEFSSWKKELSSTEVTEIYNSGTPANLKEHSAETDLQRWFRMGDVPDDGISIQDSNEHDFKLDSHDSTDNITNY